MSKVQAAVAAYYDQEAPREWDRMERHRMEFAVTWRMLERYLPPPPAQILDCGGGPGRYALELSRRGYQVTLFDLSEKNIAMAQEKAVQAGLQLESYQLGSALDLGRFAAGSFDAVLLMGPLYHLLELDERRQALREAGRCLKPGAPLFASFITRFAAHSDAARKQPLWLFEQPEESNLILEAGKLPPRQDGEARFVAYFAHPQEAPALIWENGLELIDFLGLEGLVAYQEDSLNRLQGDAWEKWVDLNERLGHDPCLYGASAHLLAVARKPAWRPVLQAIAQKLHAEQVDFTVVGGTSIALQGVWQPVKDIDLALTAEGAYRFNKLFRAHVVEPVQLSGKGLLRSHFGRFLIDGCAIDVMGDLHWRSGEEWQRWQIQDRRMVYLGEQVVPVCSLEEETLIYLRKGRLDRAALCLPKCNALKIQALLSGS
jgi:ubiquinone/menaquinone biosynthesis C-methylase UbiE